MILKIARMRANTKKYVVNFLFLQMNLLKKLENHYNKLNDIDEYIDYYIYNSIDYENLKFYLKRDNMFTRELEDWLENYMRYYNKKEEINVWEE